MWNPREPITFTVATPQVRRAQVSEQLFSGIAFTQLHHKFTRLSPLCAARPKQRLARTEGRRSVRKMVRNYKKVDRPHKSHGRVDDYTRERVVKLLSEGWKRADICKETGISTSQCRRYRAALHSYGAIHAPRKKKPGPPPKDPEKARLRDLQQTTPLTIPHTPLSSHLLAHGSPAFMLDRAIHHPFLAAAGAGTLMPILLRRWLAQDILYTRAYVRFIGSLISKLALPTEIHAKTKYGTNGIKSIPHRVFDLLVSALNNIQREMIFFESTARAYGLNLEELSEEERSPEQATHGYTRLFDSFAVVNADGPTLLEGLTVLWATEYCYLEAWTYAASFVPPPTSQDPLIDASDPTVHLHESQDPAHKALREAFIPNWSSAEFLTFVNECKECLDDLARETGIRLEDNGQIKEKNGAVVVRRCEGVFADVLHLEAMFWPEAGVPGAGLDAAASAGLVPQQVSVLPTVPSQMAAFAGAPSLA